MIWLPMPLAGVGHRDPGLQLKPFPCLQCLFDGPAALLQGLCQRQCIRGRLGRATRRVRARHERGVAQQHDAAERHLRHGQVEDELDERFGGGMDQRPERRRQHAVGVLAQHGCVAFLQRARGQRKLVLAAGAVGQHGRQVACRDLAEPHPVPAPVAGGRRAIFARHPVFQEHVVALVLEGESACEQIAVDRRQFHFRHQAPPRDVAGVARFRSWHQQLAHGGMGAVGADQQVTRLGAPAGEVRADLAAGLVEPVEGCAGMDAVGGQAGAHGRVQHVPRRLCLRLVAAVHDVARAVEVDAVAGRHGQG